MVAHPGIAFAVWYAIVALVSGFALPSGRYGRVWRNMVVAELAILYVATWVVPPHLLPVLPMLLVLLPQGVLGFMVAYSKAMWREPGKVAVAALLLSIPASMDANLALAINTALGIMNPYAAIALAALASGYTVIAAEQLIKAPPKVVRREIKKEIWGKRTKFILKLVEKYEPLLNDLSDVLHEFEESSTESENNDSKQTI